MKDVKSIKHALYQLVITLQKFDIMHKNRKNRTLINCKNCKLRLYEKSWDLFALHLLKH